jgi:Domain of unknown function (DUF3472).
MFIAAAAVAVSCGKTGTPAASDTIVPGPGAYHIPFEGNTYVTGAAGDLLEAADKCIDYQTGAIKSWNDSRTTLSFYMKTVRAGTFKLFVDVDGQGGGSTLTFSKGSKSYDLKISGSGIAYVGEFDAEAGEYARIDISGKIYGGSQFARVKEFIIDGNVLGTGSAYIPKDKLSDCYWFRRGPSVHLRYTLPSEDVEWFYNEVMVPEGADTPDTYYMLTGFSCGYMGIQTHLGGANNVLFSVWSAYETDDPTQIPSEYKVTMLKKGKNVVVRDFGNEGSGAQSFLSYEWKPGKTYRTLVHVKPDNDGSTVFTGYFGDDEGNWHLVSSLKRPHTTTWYKSPYSFLENFNPATGFMSREVHFKNQWMVTRSGAFKEVTEAEFTFDNTGRLGVRADKYGCLSGSEFILRNCGFFNESTEYGKKFKRPAGGQAPVLDLNALEAMSE